MINFSHLHRNSIPRDNFTYVCHWNIRGYRSNYYHLRTLLHHTQAVVMCLQETRLPAHATAPPRGFSMFFKRGNIVNDIDYGGVCTLINNEIPFTEIELNTPLQAVAVR